MSKDIKDYIHYYIGQDAYIFTKESATNGWLQNSIIAFPGLQFRKQITIQNIVQIIHDGYLPLLRRIEDMTEEEAIELFHLCSLIDLSVCHFEYFKEEIGWSINAFEGSVVSDAISFDNNIVSMMNNDGSLHPMNPQTPAYHWLIGKGFDLFSLIDSGAAIDAKTLQTQQQ